jgi:hypothetical protein
MTKAQPAPVAKRNAGMTEEELGRTYAQVLHHISVNGRGLYADSERQAMVDAVREFYGMLSEVLRAKAPSSNRKIGRHSRSWIADHVVMRVRMHGPLGIRSQGFAHKLRIRGVYRQSFQLPAYSGRHGREMAKRQFQKLFNRSWFSLRAGRVL